ncbi:hypothetical protein [Stappia indica]|uniref:hypothetical protein n=1 Tax=Stappia indica TaxID=538381 RepID=UPI001D193DAC|nr:hypothetical protein [Stappia indica]MCC4244177.1 hypothetical protein [Stappia indica]
MPLTNRVSADGGLHAVAARGTMMGNRGGRLHDPQTQTLGRARWRSRAWICCVLEFRGRKRQVMGEGYTELFFLDEVSAMAAGHRPCFECRRADALRYREAWQRGQGLSAPPSAPEMDRQLHGERTGERPVLALGDLARLPDGAMVRVGETMLTRREGRWLAWSFAGYRPADPSALAGAPETGAELLTPPASVAVLAAGFRPLWHDSAESA